MNSKFIERQSAKTKLSVLPSIAMQFSEVPSAFDCSLRDRYQLVERSSTGTWYQPSLTEFDMARLTEPSQMTQFRQRAFSGLFRGISGVAMRSPCRSG